MTERVNEPVVLERLRLDAICVITRLGLGAFELLGPLENILVPESYVAWATVQNELLKEGYSLVTPEVYAEASGRSSGEVESQLRKEGTLFAVGYGDSLVIALPEKEAILPEIKV